MYQFSLLDADQGGGAAALRLRAVPRLALAHAPVDSQRLAELDLVVDLGAGIGSSTWFRGLATCVALCASAAWFAPGFPSIPAASAAPMPPAQWEEARAFAIAPLALGADTGRRMAPTAAVEPLLDTQERPSLALVATLGEGDGFARALERAGVGGKEAETAASLIDAAVPLSALKPGIAMNLVLGRRASKSVPRPLDSLALRARFDLRLDLARAGDRLVLKHIPIAVDDTPLRIEGVAGSSLARAARAAGAPAKAVDTYLRAIAGQIGPGHIRPDDRFDLILEHRRAATGETETGVLLYAGLDRDGGKRLRMMRWEEDGRSQWYEASGVGRESGLLQRPVPGGVTSSFGMRLHPILGYSRMHKGVDFHAASGTPILAAADGRVAGAGWAGGYGRQVRLVHAGGLATSYSHMSRIAARIGSHVHQGEVIGYVGASGLATGPHLHYELSRNGRLVNPASVKFVGRAQLSGAQLAAFQHKLHSLLAVRTSESRTAARTGKARPTA